MFTAYPLCSALALKFRRTVQSSSMCSLREEASLETQARAEAGRCHSFSANAKGAPGVDYVTLISREADGETEGERDLEAAAGDKNQLAVWVAGYPRSGSSTILSMVSATVDDNQNEGPVFSLFEPCHDGDKFLSWKEQQGCGGVLWGLSHCDFWGISNLWGWKDPHSMNGHNKLFSNYSAHEYCAKADIVAFKTVDYGHDLAEWAWLLNSHPRMLILDVVRDPRGVYASWKTLEPFKTLLRTGRFYTLLSICESFDKNLQLEDPRVHRVIFEELLDNPYFVTKKVYDFLGQPLGSKQLQWIQQVFNNTDCPPPPKGMEGFTDCHVESGGNVREKWRSVLTKEEIAEFKNSEACQRVSKAYGWPTE